MREVVDIIIKGKSIEEYIRGNCNERMVVYVKEIAGKILQLTVSLRNDAEIVGAGANEAYGRYILDVYDVEAISGKNIQGSQAESGECDEYTYTGVIVASADGIAARAELGERVIVRIDNAKTGESYLCHMYVWYNLYDQHFRHHPEIRSALLLNLKG